jgi:tetratricopeptide (TPR) repeat protein
MAFAEPAARSARQLPAELHRLWDRGERGSAIRSALDNWDQLVASGGDLRWLQDALRTCGLPVESFALQALATRQSGGAEGWESLIRSVLNSGDAWWARALLTEVGADSRALRALGIETDLTLDRQSPAISEWITTSREPAELEAAVGWLLRSGRVEEAERLANGAEHLRLWRARFALWRNQPGIARPLLEGLPQTAEVRCLDAIASVLEGRLEQAEAVLRSLLDSDIRADAWSWLATLLRWQKRYAEAVQAADAAAMASPTFSLPTRLERELSDDALKTSPVTRLLRSIGLSRRRVADLEHADALCTLGLSLRDRIEMLERVLEQCGGNHTAQLTTTRDGQLGAVSLPQNPRHLGAIVQLVLWTRGADAARALYQEVAPSVNDHPLFGIYRGELELWMGEYETAARVFRDVLERRREVKWAWIGLGASLMLQGELREAQRTWKKGVSLSGVGPTLHVYRGECYRRRGEHAAARRELEVALREKPQRISAQINLALLDGRPEELERVERECARLAPMLMDDLAGNPAERLEQVLDAMRGNRSSSPSHVCYHLWGRVWRLAP